MFNCIFCTTHAINAILNQYFKIFFQFFLFSNKRGQVANIGIVERKSLHFVLEKEALALDVLLVLQLLLALLHVVVQQGGEPETLVAAVAGEAGVAHHVHLQLAARLEGFRARVALDCVALLLLDLFKL